MWSRLLYIGACVLALATPAWADQQGKAEYYEQILQNAAVATGTGAPIAVDRYSSIALDVTIAGTATVTFEGSVTGSAATAVSCTNTATGDRATTATATGMYQCNTAGLKGFQARISAWTSGAVTVYARATTAFLGGGGGGGSAGSSTPTLGGCWSTVSAPTYVEGVLNALSCTLTGLLRVSVDNITVLLSGEDTTNHLMRTSGGAVRVTNLMTAVSTNTTSATQLFDTGNKTFQGTLICNAGAATDCGITFKIYGNRVNVTTTGYGEELCSVTMPTGVAVTTGTCPVVSANYLYYWAVTSGVAGTSPSLTLDGMY